MQGSRTTYILRVWSSSGRAPDATHIACSLQAMPTEETRYFASLEDALAFIRQRALQTRRQE